MKLEVAFLCGMVAIMSANCSPVENQPLASTTNDLSYVLHLIDRIPLHQLEETLRDAEAHDVIEYGEQVDDVSADHGDVERDKRSADASNPSSSDSISKYKQWRTMNGYGSMRGRWGRSPQLSSLAAELNDPSLTQDERAKKVKMLLAIYKNWRQKNGYGRLAGRWGR